MATTKKTQAETSDAFSVVYPEVFKDSFNKMSQGMTNYADFQKSAFEAFANSAALWTRGIERAVSEQTAFSKEFYDESVAAARSVASAKSVQHALEVQSEFARAALEKSLGHATRIADHWTTVAKEATEPLNKRYGEFVEMVQTYRP